MCIPVGFCNGNREIPQRRDRLISAVRRLVPDGFDTHDCTMEPPEKTDHIGSVDEYSRVFRRRDERRRGPNAVIKRADLSIDLVDDEA
jgi:hypothetical protein